jgi:hypothetical protein
LCLPDAELFELTNALVDCVGVERLREPAALRRLTRRRDALLDMHQAAAHHGLDADTPPKVQQYKAAHAAGAVRFSYAEMVAAFDGFREAQSAYLVGLPRGRVRGTVTAPGGGKRVYEDPVRGVGLWLERRSSPNNAMKAYDDWVATFNEAHDDEQRPLLQAVAVTRRTGLRWSVVRDVAVGQLGFEEAVLQQSGRMLHRSNPPEGAVPELVGLGAAAGLLGANPDHIRHVARTRRFPPSAAILGAGRLWRLDDVIDYRDGQRDWSARENELRTEVLEYQDILRVVGMSRGAVDWRLHRERWDEVPPPAGRIATSWFWTKPAVQRWLNERDEQKVRAPPRSGTLRSA